MIITEVFRTTAIKLLNKTVEYANDKVYCTLILLARDRLVTFRYEKITYCPEEIIH
jgi:hypothetical protein